MMSAIEIRRVADKHDLEQFIQFRYDLYRGNPYDAPNLHSDEVFTLNPWRKNRNAAFDFCDVEYYMASTAKAPGLSTPATTPRTTSTA